MPTKRRKFSVQGNLPCSTSGMTKSSQTREVGLGPDPESKLSNSALKRQRMKKTNPLSSLLHPSLEVLAESDTEVLLYNNCQEFVSKVDKNVEAVSCNIDFITKTKTANSSHHGSTNIIVNHVPRTVTQGDSNSERRDRTPKHHRVKVRSPKRRAIMVNFNDDNIIRIKKSSVGINTVEWETDTQSENSEVEILNPDNIIPLVDVNQTHSSIPQCNSTEEMCRICHGGASMVPEFGPLVSACACRGTVGSVHVKCLEHWLTESGKSRCELCGTKYDTRRIHRYGIAKALIMWLLSQNSKQLIVDCLGIVLMSPLAIFATWLSGKTLSGLMRKEDEVAPWPLTSTFVLACMTLVCYYCWIISAVTRHSLGWWTWYRSQYEVRLNTN